MLKKMQMVGAVVALAFVVAFAVARLTVWLYRLLVVLRKQKLVHE